MDIINLTKDMYQREVMDTDKTVLIDFWATWCGPCKMIAPVIEEISRDNPELKVCKVNVDEEGELADAFKISSIPTVVLVKNKEVINSFVGFRQKEEIQKFIDMVQDF